jgi:hypothetical protein
MLPSVPPDVLYCSVPDVYRAVLVSRFFRWFFGLLARQPH